MLFEPRRQEVHGFGEPSLDQELLGACRSIFALAHGGHPLYVTLTRGIRRGEDNILHRVGPMGRGPGGLSCATVPELELRRHARRGRHERRERRCGKRNPSDWPARRGSRPSIPRQDTEKTSVGSSQGGIASSTSASTGS